MRVRNEEVWPESWSENDVDSVSTACRGCGLHACQSKCKRCGYCIYISQREKGVASVHVKVKGVWPLSPHI